MFRFHQSSMRGKKEEDEDAADNSLVRKVACCYLNVKN